MMNLSKIYGPVVGLFMGPSQPVISVCGYEAVKEALQNPDLDGRNDHETYKSRMFGQRLGIFLYIPQIVLLRLIYFKILVVMQDLL